MAAENNSVVNGLISMAMNYGNYFEDNDTEFGAESWNHIIDTETYEMLMVQTKNGGKALENLGDWHGRCCYDYYNGLSAPCPDCYLNNIRRDNFYVCIRKINNISKDYFFEGIRINHNNRPAILQKAIDISDPDYRNIVMEEYIRTKNLSNTVLGMLMDNSHISVNFENVCRVICDFFDADRALITEYITGTLNTTYSKLSQPFVQVCTELSEEAIAGITNATANLNYIWVPDVPNAERLDDSLRVYWSSHGIKSILIVPMYYDGSFIGTISLHNLRSHPAAVDTLKMMGLSVAKCIHAYVMEDKAENQRYIEPLTGALNLSGLKRKAYELLKKYPENQYCLYSLDIRYFGGINRRYGFELGDKILVKTAEVIQKQLGEDEVFCRISADVFCAMAKYSDDETTLSRFDEFVEAMQCIDELNAADYKIEFRCGAYIMDDGEQNIAQALDRSTLARRSADNTPGSVVTFFSMDLLEKSKLETELIQDFRPALAHGELSVYYQPQCNYSSKKIVGAEALVRWKSSKHGNVSPADFIPLLERHGLVYDLDRFVWEEVCKNQQKWINMGMECPISVNVSRHDMLRDNFCGELCALLDKYEIPKPLLPLEITETAYIKNSEELIGIVDMLKDAGFTVEMDDFGSGYSSLNALKDVSVDLLKLDMKFLDMGDKTGKGGSILNGIVRMTRWLDLSVLAEGVETEEQAEYLKNIGCDLMQGYYFAKPMPAEDFESLLVRNGTESRSETKRTAENDAMHPEKFMEALVDNPLLFNNMGAAAIVEYSGGNAEALMVNDNFLEMLDISREEYLPCMKDIRSSSENFLEDPNAINIYVDSSNGVRMWECSLKRRDGSTRRVRIYCRALLAKGDRSIMLVCLDDVSELSRHGA